MDALCIISHQNNLTLRYKKVKRQISASIPPFSPTATCMHICSFHHFNLTPTEYLRKLHLKCTQTYKIVRSYTSCLHSDTSRFKANKQCHTQNIPTRSDCTLHQMLHKSSKLFVCSRSTKILAASAGPRFSKGLSHFAAAHTTN